MTSKRPRGGCAGCALFAGLGGLAALGGFLYYSSRVPEDSPLARMYRTEATLTALAEAVAAYRAEYGAYPPPGLEGLWLATAFRSRHANYFPNGPEPDAWGRAYVYVPHTAYAESAPMARRDGGEYFAPGAFQLYSLGADGNVDGAVADGPQDDISNFQAGRPWRAHYKRLPHASAG